MNASDHESAPLREAEVAPVFEKLHIAEINVFLSAEKIPKSGGETGVGKETAARGTRVIMNAVMHREGHLLFPGTPRNPEETLAVHLALCLRDGNREESSAEGPENVAGVSGELVHRHESISTL
jgi:hypothetical protein